MNQNISPLVSIIIPTYNRASLLPICVQSCLDQTFRNLEIVVVDDGSTDNTAEVTAHFIEKDPRLIYLKKENGGLASALNYGFKVAKGNYLTWTSDDNFYTADAISTMLMHLERTNYSMVYCDFYKFKKTDSNVLREIKCPEIAVLNRDNCIGPCFLYSRQVMETIGEYDPETFLAEDYDYWIRVSKQFSINHLRKLLYYYMEHDESLSLKSRRNYEVQLVSILVKLKNNLMDIKGAANQFVELLHRKKMTADPSLSSMKSPFYKVIAQNKMASLWRKTWVPNKVLKMVIKGRYYKRIISILSDYKLHKTSFIDTILAIKDVFERNNPSQL